MKIQINGEPQQVNCDSLQELLEQLGHGTSTVATAVNQEFVPISERCQCQLSEGDSIDIIAPMSGG